MKVKPILLTSIVSRVPGLNSASFRLFLLGAMALCCGSATAGTYLMGETNTTNVWTLPAGPNLLNGHTVTDAPPTSSHFNETTGDNWALLTDGSLGPAGSDATAMLQAVAPDSNTSVTFPLDTVTHPLGYDFSTLDVYTAWGDSGRINQDYTISYSLVSDPATFITLGFIAYEPGTDSATHVRVYDTSGVIASNVAAIRITFNNQQNGYVGFREMIAQGAPSTVLQSNESNTTNVWTFPAGTNLLAAATPTNPPAPAGYDHGNGDITSSSWSILTNGALGSNTAFDQSAAPGNDTSVNFELDTRVNIYGYNISSFDSYVAWADSGRVNQDFTILYSTVDAPDTFIPVTRVGNHAGSSAISTHTRVAPASGYLASRVKTIQIYFEGQQNGYVGYREFIALGTPVPLTSPLTWTGASNNGTWIDGSDNNWKTTSDGAPSAYSNQAPINFDTTGTNTTIDIPATLTSADITFLNDNTRPYVFNDQELDVTNSITLAGSGSATFNNSVSVAGGLSVTGSGSLVFTAPIQDVGITLSGSGSLTLGDNNTITGSTSVIAGTLVVAADAALSASPITVTGGMVRFTSSGPTITSLAGTSGSVVLGNPDTGDLTTLFVGDATLTTYAGTITDASGAAIGSLDKVSSGSLVLSGANTYTGTTTVEAGLLEFALPAAFYSGNHAAWTAGNASAYTNATLGFRVGDPGEFTSSDLAALDPDIFQSGSFLGLNTDIADFTLSNALSGGFGVVKTGTHTLTVTGANTYTGNTRVLDGVLVAQSTSGPAFAGNVTPGGAGVDVVFNLEAANQFGPDSGLTVLSGSGGKSTKVNLRGHDQALAGLDCPAGNNIPIVQNDESTEPGFTSKPGPVTLTLNEAGDHSFTGIIREQDGGTLSVVKNGPGTQEFGNVGIQGYGYNGNTTINQGTVRLKFNSGFPSYFPSNVVTATGTTFDINAEGVTNNWNFYRTVSGTGKLVKSGAGYISLVNQDGYANANTYSGGTDIQQGILKFYAANSSAGEGTGPGQYCAAGLMDPANVITVRNGATMGIGAIAALGNSGMLPQYANTIKILPGGRLWGGDGTNNIAFLANVSLDGALVEVTEGLPNGFNTNLAFVGTVVVGGTSTTPSTVITTGTGSNATLSLGSLGLPGTTFQVADVTGDAAVDFSVNAIVQDVGGQASPLVKTGPGTMSLLGANTYTGTTSVLGGVLAVTGTSIPDANAVIIDGGKLDIATDANETVGTLYFGATQQVAGTYGSSSSTATFKDDTRFSGSGILTVTFGPGSDPYSVWASQIADPAQRGRTADPDGDGFTNQQEYLFGTSPVASTGSLSQLSGAGSVLTLHWNQRTAGSSVYVVQESTDLATWTTSTVTITNGATQDLPDYTRKEAAIPVDSVRKFYRVQATE